MRLHIIARLGILQTLYAWLPHVKASQYGENHDPVEKDEDLVAAHFPDTDQVLLSPAFLAPESVLAGFADGTDGPTDDAVLGVLTYLYRCNDTYRLTRNG